MKLLALISLALSLSPFAVNALASSVVRARSLDEVTKRELSNLLPRDESGITMCDGTSHSGNCNTFQAAEGTCNPVPDHFQTNLLSSYANQGYVCYLYTTGSCTPGTCEACVDSGGFNDMTSIPAVYSWKCETADANGCSDANCVFH